MKEIFFEYYPREETQIKAIWKNCLFIYDTNVLLNFYRYTDQTRNKFFEVIEKLQNRNILPYHTAFEFHKNRLTTIAGQSKAYDNLIDFFNKKYNEIESELNKYKKHTYIQSSLIKDKYESTSKKIIKRISTLKTDHPDYYINDIIKDRITELFSGKITNPYDEKKLAEIYKSGKFRYEKEIPPGYEDLKEKRDKDESSLYGDLIIWFQIMDISKEKSLPIVFVTDDLKDDWWYRFNGKTIGPRPELLKEFNIYTDQQILIYNADSFLNYAREYTGINIDPTIVNEIIDLREKDESILASRRIDENNLNILRSIAVRDKEIENKFSNFREIESLNNSISEVFKNYQTRLSDPEYRKILEDFKLSLIAMNFKRLKDDSSKDNKEEK